MTNPSWADCATNVKPRVDEDLAANEVSEITKLEAVAVEEDKLRSIKKEFEDGEEEEVDR